VTANFQRESAKIYQFPVRGRTTGLGQFSAAQPAMMMSAQVAQALGGSWYHEEAVQEALEAERTRKN
jgi:hypothetical protein